MAASFVSLPDRILFSSELANLRISTDARALDVTVSISPGENNPVYAETLFAYGRIVSLPLDDIVENAMRARASRGLAPTIFSVSVQVVDHDQKITLLSKTIRTLYCHDRPEAMPPQLWLQSFFLTPAQARRIPVGEELALAAFVQKGESMECVVSFSAVDTSRPDSPTVSGSFRINEGVSAAADAVRYIVVSAAAVAAAAADAAHVRTDDIRISSFAVRMGRRSAAAFISPELDAGRAMVFFNRFLAREYIWLFASRKATVSLERETARVSGRVVPYGPRSVTLNVSKTARLLPGEISMLEDLADSPSVGRLLTVFDDDAQTWETVDVVVSDVELVYDEGTDEPPVASVSWRDASDRRSLPGQYSLSRFTDPYFDSFC